MCTRPFGDDEVTFLSRSTVSTVDGEIYNKNIVIDGCLLFLFCHVITSSFDFLFREYLSVVNQYEMKI